MQSLDLPTRPRVLINVDETSVRLVPEEGRGHVSNIAYRLFMQGKPVGRRASQGKLRSAITHIAAICDSPMFQCLLPQLVLVGQNQFRGHLSPESAAVENKARSIVDEIMALKQQQKAAHDKESKAIVRR